MVEPLGPGDPTEIAGYVLRGKLGEGGMGSVYLSHTRGGQPVALKVIRREFARNPEFLRRFTREVQAAHRVQGAYTAPVIDSGTAGPQPWLASAYVTGPSLADAVFEHGPLPLQPVLLLTAGIAEALQSIHAADVVHRDLKPSNVLLAADGPRVIDFGIARSTEATALTGTDVRLGTPAYMSPEQAQGTPVTSALDVFALGLITHFAATGRHPFGEGDAQALLYRIVSQQPDLASCPGQLHPLVTRCLAKEPAKRPSLAHIIEECHRIAAAEGMTLARDEGWWRPSPSSGGTAQQAAAVSVPSRPSPGPAPQDGPEAARSAAPDPRRPYEPTALDPRSSDSSGDRQGGAVAARAMPGDDRSERPEPAAADGPGGPATVLSRLFGGPYRRVKVAVVVFLVLASIVTGLLSALGVLEP
ncbi:protein kinase domain-containing protein [Streptomyces albus]|uniref:serine/threonine-protein kinase n=1 Tax=Streptomyces albus TaxID=1888 RepID=UPI003F1CC5E7